MFTLPMECSSGEFPFKVLQLNSVVLSKQVIMDKSWSLDSIKMLLTLTKGPSKVININNSNPKNSRKALSVDGSHLRWFSLTFSGSKS